MSTHEPKKKSFAPYVAFLVMSLGPVWWFYKGNVQANPLDAAPPPPPPAPAAAELSSVDAGAPDTSSTTATIVFVTTPAVAANVTWGKKLLGRILPGKPLVVVRPRDSGPLDVMVRAQGYMAVQTRAHTFSDSRVLVKLTPPENAFELLGYRAPLEAGVDGGLLGDGGVPGEAGAFAPTSVPDASTYGWDSGFY